MSGFLSPLVLCSTCEDKKGGEAGIQFPGVSKQPHGYSDIISLPYPATPMTVTISLYPPTPCPVPTDPLVEFASHPRIRHPKSLVMLSLLQPSNVIQQ